MATYSKLADLTASLAARKADSSHTNAVVVNDAPAPEQVAATESEPLYPQIDALAPNQSFSVFQSDLEVLENVRMWLSKRGLPKCGASEAVRLCIRLAGKESNADLLAELCRAARAKDGRKTRHLQKG